MNPMNPMIPPPGAAAEHDVLDNGSAELTRSNRDVEE